MKGHIRRQGRGSWELKFDTGSDPETGKRRIRYVTVCGTKRHAESELAQYLAQLGQGTYIEPSKITVADQLESWLTSVQAQVSAKTHERYAEIVRGHLIPALGKNSIVRLSPRQIADYYTNALTANRARRRSDGNAQTLPPLSAQTVKHHHRILSQALKQAVRLKVIAYNPANDVDAPRPTGQEMQTLDLEQSAKLLQKASQAPMAIIVLVALTTGLRRGEILGLRWQDVQLAAGCLSVRQTLEETKNGLAFKAPKTKRSRRTVALPALAIDGLRRHRARQAEQMLALGIRQTSDTLVCSDAAGRPLRPRNVTKAFGVLAKRLNLKVRFHDLRHTHISHLLAAGVHPKVASERAGHASTAITMDTYSHVLPGMQEEAANRIDAALRTHLER